MKEFVLISVLFLLGVNSTLRKPKDASELQSFLDKARAGDIIELMPIEYSGSFTVSESSLIPEIPITIRGVSASNTITKMTNPSGLVFNVTASHYIFRTMWIINSQTGMVISGNENELDGLTLKDTKEGIVVSGKKNKLQAMTMSNVDVGLVFKSSEITLQHSSITSGNISLEIEKEACCNVLDNNVFNGYVNLRGDGNKFSANVANGGMLAVGCKNEFNSNVIQQMKLTKKCENPDKGLNVFNKSPDMDFE